MSAICNVVAAVAFWSPHNIAVETTCHETLEACQHYINEEAEGDPGDYWTGDCVVVADWPPTTRQLMSKEVP